MICFGDEEELFRRQEAMAKLAVDQTLFAPEDWAPPPFRRTLAQSFSVVGPGTYNKHEKSRLHFLPEESDWLFERMDLEEQLPVRVDVGNVWTASRSIVLRSGGPHNYVRMTEHIIAQRLGLFLDGVRIQMGKGDPPLFDVGSMPIVEGIQNAGFRNTAEMAEYWTVAEPVALLGKNVSFLLMEPREDGRKLLSLDVAIDFPTAIGQQRIQFDLTPEIFTYGAHARTNCSRWEMFLFHTIGKFFADYRNMGYTRENILVAGKHKYTTTPKMLHKGKSLEAVWHRACLDLLAALSLFSAGRLAGKVTSFKAGHSLDCRWMTLVTKNGLWKRLP